jgi:hypothetical protein
MSTDEDPAEQTIVYVVTANSGYMEMRDQWIVGVYTSEREARDVALDEERGDDTDVEILSIMIGQRGHHTV